MEGVNGVFGMRHEREDASCRVANAGDVVGRPVRVVVVAEKDLVVLFQLTEDVLGRVVSTLAVCDGDAERCLFGEVVGKLELEVLPCADESP